MNVLDTKELTRFEKQLLDIAQKTMPREGKKFLRKQGSKLRKKTLSTAKSRVKKKTGNLFKGIKTGDVYVYRGNGGQSIRVYGGKPAYHLHLLEEGHRMIKKDGSEGDFVEGKHFFRDAAVQFEGEHYSDTEEFIDSLLEKGLR